MITTGDTRMSVMPQVAFPAPVQISPPLAAFNSGVNTAANLAQLAEEQKMQPLREKMAQLQEQQLQKQVNAPIWDLKSQTTELQPRDTPPTDQGAPVDGAAYDALIKGGLTDAQAVGALIWQGPNVSGESMPGAHKALTDAGFDEDRINALLNPPEPPPTPEVKQDLYTVSTYADRNNPGRTRTERALHKTAEQVAAEAALTTQRGREKDQWVTKDVTDPADPSKVITLSTNLTTGESKILGGAAKTTSQIALSQVKAEAAQQAMKYAAQTQQARAIWASVIGHVPDQHELTQMELEARTIGANVPMLALIDRSSSSFYIKSYMKALSSQNPDVRASAQDALPEDPAIRKSILAEIDQISKAAPALGAQLNTANGITVPGMTPGAPAVVPAITNPPTIGASAVTQPRTNFPAPVSVAPAKNFATLQAAQAAYAAGALQVGDKVTVGGQPGTWQ
jgi:hypothetical protein